MRVNLVATLALSVVLVHVCLCLPHRATLDNRADSGLQVNWTSVDFVEDIQAINPSYMNLSVDPCDDFYEYACGNWKHVHPIEKDEWISSVFELMYTTNLEALRESLSEPVSSAYLSQELGAEEKARVYFAACNDVDTIEKRGLELLMQFIDELGGWPVLDDDWSEEEFDWLELATKTSLLGKPCILATYVSIDRYNTTRHTLYLSQPASISSSYRDNFLRSKFMEYMDDYKYIIVQFLIRLGVDSCRARKTAQEIVDFEKQLADIISDDSFSVELTDRKGRASTTIEGLYKRYPNIDWLTYLSGVQETSLQPNQSIVVFAENYYDNLGSILDKTKPRTLANFMVWRMVLQFASALDLDLFNSLKAFEKVLAGHEEPVARWKNCVQEVDAHIGMVTGAMYVRRYFDEDSKNETISLLSDIKEAFRENVLNLDWIDDKTKDLILRKLNQMEHSVGYSDFILSPAKLDKLYTDLQVVPEKYFENLVNLRKHTSRVRRKRLQERVNKDEEVFTPTTVNAVYYRMHNKVYIPAGILQPPVFHKKLPTAQTCAGSGTVMGHEVTHGFDDSSREYDSSQNRNEFWSPEALKGFKERVNCFIEQYGKYSVDKIFVNGTRTVNDNIADNGAIRQAFKVYGKRRSLNGTPSKEISGLELTNDQLFFVGFAQLWCEEVRPSLAKVILTRGHHAPNKFRVIGSLSNFEEFSEAFQCPTGSYMNPNKKCRLW